MHHNKFVPKRELGDIINIIEQANNIQKLLIKEALLIQQKESIINKQFDYFPNILNLCTKLDNLQS